MKKKEIENTDKIFDIKLYNNKKFKIQNYKNTKL